MADDEHKPPSDLEKAALLVRRCLLSCYGAEQCNDINVRTIPGNPPYIYVVSPKLDKGIGYFLDDFQQYVTQPYGIPVEQRDPDKAINAFRSLRIPITRDTVIKMARAYGDQGTYLLGAEMAEMNEYLQDPEIVATMALEATMKIRENAIACGAGRIFHTMLQESSPAVFRWRSR